MFLFHTHHLPTFVENAFRYGSTRRETNDYIHKKINRTMVCIQSVVINLRIQVIYHFTLQLLGLCLAQASLACILCLLLKISLSFPPNASFYAKGHKHFSSKFCL